MAYRKKYKALVLKQVPCILKIYALYFSSFGMAEKQQLTKVDFLPLFLSRFSAAQERLFGLPKQTYGI